MKEQSANLSLSPRTVFKAKPLIVLVFDLVLGLEVLVEARVTVKLKRQAFFFLGAFGECEVLG